MIISIVGAVIGVGVVGLIVWLIFRKKTEKEHISDSELIERNSKAVDVIIAIVENDDIKSALRDLREKLKYLQPSEKDNVYEADEYISHLLREFRIKQNSAPDNVDISKACIKQIDVSIESRNSML
ncbi:MAG: hypothetical protein J1F71_02240 [Clostridiales bacterium]|nr:hypothetical protein [Clostridiales bacterium]